jgi:hypothetical protein
MVERRTKYFLLPLLLCLLHCSNRDQKPAEKMIAVVGDRTITEDEFIRRAEYAIRPPYCRSNGTLEKKIVLNSLIAEKMLALEAGTDHALALNDHFRKYLLGRTEQAMRDVLVQEEGFDKVRLNSQEVSQTYQLAGRTYHIDYYAFSKDSLFQLIVREQASGREEVFARYSRRLSPGDTIGSRNVEFTSLENREIRQALFSQPLRIGQSVGPIRLAEDEFLLMRIKGWQDRISITDADSRQRLQSVREILTADQAAKHYSEFVAEVMRGKRVDFHPSTFRALVQILGQAFFSGYHAVQEANLLLPFARTPAATELDSSFFRLESIKERPLLRIDRTEWKMQDFLQAYERHPLVFRKKRIKKVEFAEQLQLAIVDMIRDQYLTQEAYRRGYDRLEAVAQDSRMWLDAEVALYEKFKYLKKRQADTEDPLAAVPCCLNPYVDSLQLKYSSLIRINIEALAQIDLTRIDMFAVKQNAPFPVVVPSFPLLTTDARLDYGAVMK